MSETTPLPWRVQGWEQYDEYGNAGTFILGGGPEGSADEHLVGAALPQPTMRNRKECDANAALIVEAVNSHAALVAENAALRERVDALESLLVCYRVGKRPTEALLKKLDTTRAALGETNK